MKINTDISNNFFACFDEARGFAINKRRIIKKGKTKYLSFVQSAVIIFICLLIVSMFFCLKYQTKLAILFYIIAWSYFLFISIIIFINYLRKEKQHFNNVIKFDKTGITDESYYNVKMTLKWDKIIGIVFGKYTITFLTDTPLYFYFDINKAKDIKTVLKKYDQESKIIK